MMAVFVVPLAMGPAVPVQKVTSLALERDPILQSGVNGTLGDNGWYTSAATVWIQKNGTVNYTLNYTRSNATWFPYTAPFLITFNGTTYVEFRGYINSTANETIRYDVKVDRVKPFTNVSFRDPFFRLLPTDNVSGVAKTMFKVDKGNWSEFTYLSYQPTVGPHIIYYYSIDRAGNTEATRNVSIKVTRDPILDYGINGTLGLNGWYKSAATLWVKKNGSVNYTLDNVTWHLYVKPFVITYNGTTIVELRGFINATLNETIKIEVKVDCVMPVTEASFGDPVFSMVASDNVSGVAKTMFKVDDGKWWLYLEPYKPLIGTHNIQYYSIDQAGNAEAVKNITVVVAPHTRTTEAGIVIASLAVGLGAFFFVIRRKPVPHTKKEPEEETKREDWN
jgi:hypothetical protein